MAGYSNTPLAKKLGIKEGFKIYQKNPPDGFMELLEPLPANITVLTRTSRDIDVFHIFTKSINELATLLESSITRIKQNGMIWVSWPKKSSKVKTDITEDTIRELALPMNLVDIKVCAIDETWSALKLVIRKEYRK